ncbi:MAG: contractile injection system tape measure protein [Crocinitomicaceae bacterium]|nr:contractile injection system tape measure protein [Crocinitomicaceae bacterium]
MRSNLHTVKRISVDLETERGTPFEERSRILNAFEKDLKVELEKVMDELCRSDEVIRIDQLKIDLGNIDKNQFGSLFIEEFRRQLRESIVKVKHEQSMSADQQSQTVHHYHSPEESAVFKKSKEGREFDAILFFLNKGAIPWWSPYETLAELEAAVQELEKKSEQYLSPLNIEFMNYSRSRERFIFTFENSTVLKLMQVIFSASFKKQTASVELLEKFFRNQLTQRTELTAKRKILQITNNCVLQNLSKEKLIRDFIQLHKISFKEKDQNEWTEKKVKQEEIQKILKSTSSFETDQSPEEWYDLVIKEVNIPTKKKKPLAMAAENESELNPEMKESIRLNYAGVVITWPMLKTLFDARALLEEGQFIDESSQHKAIRLLNYLVSGNESLEEHEMPINKLLCGVHPSFPLREKIPLTEEDKTEVDELLDHIISTWSGLGNTSREGVRTSFIQREGMLEEREQSWFVKVEQSGIDILMGKIPWGYSMIKLPWMEKMIQVEW